MRPSRASEAGTGVTRDLSRTVVYAVNSTAAKAVGQNQRSMGIAPAAFAQWARSAVTGDRAQNY